jgi:hypothetical protein
MYQSLEDLQARLEELHDKFRRIVVLNELCRECGSFYMFANEKHKPGCIAAPLPGKGRLDTGKKKSQA